ncbi:hypothetical protein ECE50_028855 [Chitinophaga sp. Mgbs1]|uniref:Uncharacterized protein n=1 Tax=Chitinophaga solisilvae TaxID=1233460 RepID=A0A9Q5D4J4_9BACT|nr:hypothetical protein [Chitinophaga solisilvae]
MRNVCMFVTLFWLSMSAANAQVASLVAPNNNSFAGLEKNLLFHADKRFKVTLTGPVQVDVSRLFDGALDPFFGTAPSESNPMVVLVENLPLVHTQKKAYVGWTARYQGSSRFKIEGFETGVNDWIILADVSNTSLNDYIAEARGTFSKLRYTFYNGIGAAGAIGLSELFFLHGEYVMAYDGLMVQYDRNNNVKMGSNALPTDLSVNGTISAKRLRVLQQGWADFVFEPDYKLPDLSEVESFIRQHRHLPEIPSAAVVQKEGVDLGDVSAKLLQKIEELTLYMIEQQKKMAVLSAENKEMKEKIEKLTR